MKSEFANIKVIWEELIGPQDSTPIDFIWNDSMKSMLGKTYKVLPKTIGKKDPDIVALPSPDGSLNAKFHQITYSKRKWADGNWYFPSTVVTKIDLPKPKDLNVIEDESKPKILILKMM